ncbi:MAG: leucine-rich repeat domain-containing protein [Prevotella sp.]|nr:leucine-rich repeat domain-containing protein [Prevotella sp.]
MKKQILLTIAAMLLPMSMMAQGYHFVMQDGLEYICKDGDEEDDDHLFIWVGSNAMTVLVDGQSVSSGRYIEHSSLRPQLRRDYNSDQGEFYKSTLESIKTIASTYKSPNTFNGIQYFRNLESLSLNSQDATSVDLDLSQNTKLKTLTFNQTAIKLRTLNISNTQLTSLTIPSGSQTTLTNLYVSNSEITSLNLGSCSNLRVLDADNIAFSSNSALTLPTTTNKLDELSLEGVTGLKSIDVSRYSALATLHVNGSSIEQLTLPTATGMLKHLNLSDNTNLGNFYTHANPLDVSMYSRLVAVVDEDDPSSTHHSNTGGKLLYENSGLSVYLGSDGNLKIYPDNAVFIRHTCSDEEAAYDYMDYTSQTNLIGLVLTGAQGVRLPANRTTFVLDLTGSPNIAEVDFNNSASTLTSLNAVNVKKIDVSACSELQELLYTGPASENLVLATASGSYPDLTTLVLTKSSVKTLDLKGGGTSETCIAPNLQNFRAFYSALEEIDLSNHAQLNTLSLLPLKNGHDESVQAYGINAFNEGNKLKTLKIANCTNLTGEVALNFVGSNWYYYNALEYIDASGCTGITQFECPNNLLEHLNLSNCSSLELIDITQGRLTGNGDIDLSGCNNLSVFNASRNRWESMDFLLKPSSSRTAEDIGKLESIRVNGGSYTLTKDNVRYVREYNGEPMIYTSRLTELDLSKLDNGTFKELHCEDNLIQSLDLSTVGPGMTTLKCANNMMLTLNLNSLNHATLDVENSSWSPQVAYLNAEVVKGDYGTDAIDGAHDWVAIHLEEHTSEGFTHKLDNTDPPLRLYDNLYSAFNNGKPLATETSPWMCLVSETTSIPDFNGHNLDQAPGHHAGYHIFLHSQDDIVRTFGSCKDQDLYGKVLVYRYNTGYNQNLTANPINGSPDTPDGKEITPNSLDPHIEIRAHIWPYIININHTSMNDESKAQGVDYFSSTLCLDYDAVIPEGVQCYFISGIRSKKSITHGGTSQVDNQLTMVPFGGDGCTNKILPAKTPVYVRSKVAAGLYSFDPVWEFDIKGWENLRNIDGYDNAPHILHGVQPTDTRTVKPKYVAALDAAKKLRAEMMGVDEDGKKWGNILTGVLGEKYSVTDMEAEYFNKYSRSDTTLAASRTCLGLGLQSQKKDPVTGLPTKVIGFWPYNSTKVPAHRCIILEDDYYAAVAAAEAKGEEIATSSDSKGGVFYFEGEDGIEVTGIEDVNEEPVIVDDEWYTLQGLRLNKRPTHHGVYIHNGKKVTIK